MLYFILLIVNVLLKLNFKETQNLNTDNTQNNNNNNIIYIFY